MNDGGAGTLDVTGLISAQGATLVGAGGATITAGITATSGNIQVSAGSIALGGGGVLLGGTVDLDGTTAGIVESGGGSIVAATLLSSTGANGNVDLSDANAIGTLGPFLVNNGTFHLGNGGTGLAVTGSVIASSVTLDGLSGTLAISDSISATAPGGLISLTDTGGVIALNGGAVVSGPTIDMHTGSIALTGNAILGNSTALIDLTTTAGGVTEASTGTILAATLQSSGGIANSVSLGGVNTIAAIGSLAVGSSGTFTLADNGNLGVGTLTASSITIGDTGGTLTVQNSLIATSAVSLTATTILIPGEVSDGGAGTTSLVANGGSIGETGTLIAGTLNGSATGAATLLGSNTIQTVGSFNAGGFMLNDGTALGIGTVIGGTLASIDVAGTLTVNTLVSANTIDLTATSITVPGTVNAAGTVDLIANAGSIIETGTLIAGLLIGSANAAANLGGAMTGTTYVNQVGTLGSFTATSLVLDDGVALTVAGPVNGGSSVAIGDNQLLTVTGSLLSAGLMNLTGSAIAITGTAYVSDGGNGTTGLTATAGTIYENATLISGTLDGSATGSASFLGTNTIANVGSFNAAGFILNDGTTALNIGSLIGGTLASIDVAGILTVNTLISASTVDLTATTIMIPGLVNAGTVGSVSLTANTGSIVETGTLIAGTLSGSATGAANLGGFVNGTTFANQIGTLGSFTATSFVLNDGAALEVTGPVNGGSSVAIDDSQALTVTGSLVSSNLMTLTGSVIAMTGAGYVSDGGNGTTDITATGGAINDNATLIAGTLFGSATGAANFSGFTATSNQILNIGSFGSAGFILNDGTGLNVGTSPGVGAIGGGAYAYINANGPLTVNGIISASQIYLMGNTIQIPGEVTSGAPGTVTLVASNGVINESGTLIAGTLSGSSSGMTDLAGTTPTTNQIVNLSNFSASILTVDDGASLAVIGGVAATTGSVDITTAGALSNSSSITANTSVTLLAASTVTNAGEIVAQGGTASVTATAGTLLSSGLIQASSDATLGAGSSLTNTSTGTVIAGGNASLTASNGTLFNGGLVLAGGNATLGASGDLTNTGSAIAQGGNAALTAGGALSNSGLVQASSGATLGAGSSLTNTGSVVAQTANASLTASDGTLFNSGAVLAGANATLGASTGRPHRLGDRPDRQRRADRQRRHFVQRRPDPGGREHDAAGGDRHQQYRLRGRDLGERVADRGRRHALQRRSGDRRCGYHGDGVRRPDRADRRREHARGDRSRHECHRRRHAGRHRGWPGRRSAGFRRRHLPNRQPDHRCTVRQRGEHSHAGRSDGDRQPGRHARRLYRQRLHAGRRRGAGGGRSGRRRRQRHDPRCRGIDRERQRAQHQCEQPDRQQRYHQRRGLCQRRRRRHDQSDRNRRRDQ